MRRFYIDKNAIKAGQIVISGKEAHHIKDVIRLKSGDRFIGFDGEGRRYTLLIVDCAMNVKAKIEKVSSRKIAIPEILLCCALPKKGKMDYIVEKATELGVADIVPMITNHTIVKVDKVSALNKHRRWEKVALEASKQCGRDTLPTIHGVTNFQDGLKMTEKLGCKNRVIAYVSESSVHIKDVLCKKQGKTAVFIGPEGDFSEGEIVIAKDYGFKTVSLGELVLKVDTAAIFAISLIHSIN